jgi:membrane-associated phospholipid phosphatase
MENHQSNQPGFKSSEISVARFISPLMAGIILCWLSFLCDQLVIQWVKAHELKPVKGVAGFLSNWGDWPELMLFACLGLGLAWIARSRVVCKVVLCMMIAATISGAMVNCLRFLAGRARPNNTEATQEWNGLWRGREFLFFKNKYHSFPSGHTGVAFAFFGVAFFANRQYGWWALFAASANAWSRIYLNVHHLSDITVGALIGLVIASLVWEYLEPQVDRFLGHFFPVRVPPQNSRYASHR